MIKDFLSNFLNFADKLSNDDLNVLLSDQNINSKYVCFAWERDNRFMLTIKELCQLYLRPKVTRISLFNIENTAFISYTFEHQMTFHED